MNNFLPQKRGMQVVWIIVGCLIYAVGLNVFIIPMNLYSGGAVGLAQLLSYGAGQIGIKEIAGLNLYGIIYLLLNIPILFIAWFKIGKTFFYKYNPWNGRNQFIYFNRTNSGNSSDR